MRVRLGGTVLDDDSAKVYRYFGYRDVCCPNDVRDAIRNCPKDEELIFEINSGGGSVYNGFEMYTVLRQEAQGKAVVAEIQSIAASAAAVFASGCGKVRISPVGNFMIHRASTSARGNAGTMRQAEQMLGTIDESILNAFADKCGEKCGREEIRTMLENETFMTAQEAVEKGFVDEVMFCDEEPQNIIQSAAAAMQAGLMQAIAVLPPIEELKRQKGVEDKNKQQEKEEHTMTREELERENADLVNDIRAEAAKAERERILAIDEVSMPGYEDLIAKAKEDPGANAGTVAMEIVARQKKQGEDFLTARENDADDSKVNNVETSGEPASATGELERVLDEAFPQE